MQTNRQPKTIKVWELLVFIVMALWIGAMGFSAFVGAASGSQDKPFDHNQCQYPMRASNPPDGCDNSDPADPTQVKGEMKGCTE